MEDDQNGRRLKWKTTKMEDDQNGRGPKWNGCEGRGSFTQPASSAIPRFRDFLIRGTSKAVTK